MTREQIDAVPNHRDHVDLFDEGQALAMDWAEAMTLNRAAADDALFAALRSHFTDQEIVELSMAAAVWNMTNRLNESLHTQLEGHPSGPPRTHVSRQAVQAYVRRVSSAGAGEPTPPPPAPS